MPLSVDPATLPVSWSSARRLLHNLWGEAAASPTYTRTQKRQWSRLGEILAHLEESHTGQARRPASK